MILDRVSRSRAGKTPKLRQIVGLTQGKFSFFARETAHSQKLGLQRWERTDRAIFAWANPATDANRHDSVRISQIYAVRIDKFVSL